MARTANFNEKISVGNNREMTIGDIEKFYNRNNGRISFTNNGFVLTDKIGKESLTINLAELTSSAVYTLLVSSLGKSGKIYERFYASGTPSYEVAEVTSNLLQDKKNHGLINEIAATDNGKPFVDAVASGSVKLEDVAKRLTPEQAPGVITGLQKEVEAKKTELVTLNLWNSLSESAKYSPDVLSKLLSTTGVPLITNNKDFKKFVNKDKMLAAIAKKPERLNDFVKAFGRNAIFSDTVFVKRIAEVLSKKAVSINKPEKQTEYINQIKSLTQKAQEYNLDARYVKKYAFKPAKAMLEEYNAVSSYDSKNEQSKSFDQNILTEKQRNMILKLAVNHIVKNMEKGSKKSTIQRNFESLIKEITENKKLKVTAEQVFEDKQLMRDLVVGALPAAFNKKFFHDNQKDVRAKDIAKYVNAFGSEVLRRNKEHDLAFEEVHALNTSATIELLGAKFSKDLPELPKLKDKSKIKILNKIGKLNFNSKNKENSIKVFNKIIKDNEKLIFNDAKFVASISEVLHQRALKEALTTPPKGKDVKEKYKHVSDKFKPLIDEITNKLDTNIKNVNGVSLVSQVDLVDEISKKVTVNTSKLPKLKEAKKESLIKTISKLEFAGKKPGKANDKFNAIIKKNPDMFNDIEFVNEVAKLMHDKAVLDATKGGKVGNVIEAYDTPMSKFVSKFSKNMENFTELSKSVEDLDKTLSKNKDYQKQAKLAKEMSDEQEKEHEDGRQM